MASVYPPSHSSLFLPLSLPPFSFRSLPLSQGMKKLGLSLEMSYNALKRLIIDQLNRYWSADLCTSQSSLSISHLQCNSNSQLSFVRSTRFSAMEDHVLWIQHVREDHSRSMPFLCVVHTYFVHVSLYIHMLCPLLFLHLQNKLLCSSHCLIG